MQPLSLVKKKVPVATFLQLHCRHIVKNKFRRREAISSKSARSFLNIYCFCFSLFVDIVDVINVKTGTPQRKEGVLYTFSSSFSFHIFIVSRKKGRKYRHQHHFCIALGEVFQNIKDLIDRFNATTWCINIILLE